MKRNQWLIAMALALCSPAMAQTTATTQVAGYRYGTMAQPTGWEWQSVDSVAYNKEQPRAYFFSFKNSDQARQVLPHYSSYVQSLNGKWKFHWVGSPEQRAKDFYLPSYDVSGWDNIEVPFSWNMAGFDGKGNWKYGRPLYVNQRVMFQHHVAVNDWKGGVMRKAPKGWLTHEFPNEVGAYRRTFQIPSDWKGREVYINFDGVDSFFYLWINGKYVGFSKNSRNLARFDISSYLVPGENVIAAEVYRQSDGSFLESQDMFRLPGIFRDVYLSAKPKVQVRDLVAIPYFQNANSQRAGLQITASIANLTKKKQKDLHIDYRLYEVALYGDQTTPLNVVGRSSLALLKGNTEVQTKLTLQADQNVKPWSAERPQRYVLVGELKDKKGNLLETFSTYVGFRQIEIKDTPASQDEFGLAGRYYYLNGQPIKFKGVNRHENNLSSGHTVSHEQMENEVMLMKRANINHVRNCHYPDAPYWYYLCDKYGIYLEDEANIESHEYYYGDASLSHVKEMRNAHVARELEMVHATINHPSVAIWSLGNEAGPGENFVAGYKAIKAFDTSRPIQYERNNNIVDMGSNQYPSVEWVESAATGKMNIKYPFHISEYAHSMGNAVGDLINYWNAIESSNFVMGGAIWDWVDQALYNYDPQHQTLYWGYGGDFRDKPNDGMFCMNGILRPDFTPKAQYYEVKKVYQNIGVRWADAAQGAIEVFNKNYFEPLLGYDIVYTLWKDGKQVGAAQPLIAPRNIVGPREKVIYRLPNLPEKDGEYFVKIQFRLGKDMPWAKKGYVQMEEQLPLYAALPQPGITTLQPAKATTTTTENAQSVTITGKNFKVVFDKTSGSIAALEYNGKSMIQQGPALNTFRAPVDNDVWVEGSWFNNGLNDLRHRATQSKIIQNKKGEVLLSFHIESQAPCRYNNYYSNTDRNPEAVHKAVATDHKMGENDFKLFTNLIYTVYPDGTIALRSSVKSNRPDTDLARMGYALTMPKSFDHWTYYGRGPVNNYSDRKTSQFIERHETAVADSYILLPKPQAMGNREDVRWMAVTDNQGDGLLFCADSTFSCSVLPWSQNEIMGAAHICQLPTPTATHLHIDAKVRGLGGASCGPSPLNKDLVKATNYPSVGFLIRPVHGNNIDQQAQVSNNALQPLTMQRSRAGIFSIDNPRKEVKLWIQINNQRPKVYDGKPFNFKKGGTIKVYYEDHPELPFTAQYEEIKRIPIEVIYTSSFEPGNNNEGKNLVDGDMSTIWHTQYGVTLSKYPHWVDFDAAESKVIKGFVYVPRQDNPNGRVKNYEIFVSNDNSHWELVAKGTFANNTQPQKVNLPQTVKARYIRFKALSEQNGNDYASGAEFEVLTQ